MRIVLFRTDKIGDLIVSTSIITAIKAKHPDAKIMLVAAPYNVVAAQGLTALDEIIVYEENAPQLTLEKIRAFNPTHALALSPREECYRLARQSGAKHQGWIIMAYRPWVRLLAAFLLPRKNREIITRNSHALHHSEHILNLARRTGLAAAGDFPYLIPRDTSASHNIKQQLIDNNITRPFIAVHLVDKWVDENWQSEDIKNFLLMLRDKLGVDIIASAGPADKLLTCALQNDFVVLNNLSFAQWVALFEQSKLVIAPDCAAVHIACGLQKPLLALYQPSRMEIAMSEYGPRHTDYRARALLDPKKIIPFLFQDIRDLSGLSHF